MSVGPKAGTFRSAWRHRRWRALIAGTAISGTGDFLYAVALVVHLIEETGSAGWAAGALTARMAACTLLGPIGGALADQTLKVVPGPVFVETIDNDTPPGSLTRTMNVRLMRTHPHLIESP